MKNFHYHGFTEIYWFKDIRHLMPVFGPISTTYYCLKFIFTGVDVRRNELILQDFISNDGNRSILLLVLLEKQPCQHTMLDILVQGIFLHRAGMLRVTEPKQIQVVYTRLELEALQLLSFLLCLKES